MPADAAPTPDPLANARVVSPRWVTWRQRIKIVDYERRFAEMEAAGTATHGEADFIERYQPRHCLDAGCGTGRVAVELARRGIRVMGIDLDADMLDAARGKAPQVEWAVADLARMELEHRFDLVALPGNVMIFCQPHDRGAIVANLARHLEPTGRLVAGFSLEPGGYGLADWDADCASAGLDLVERYATWDLQPWDRGDYHVSVHQQVA